MSLIPFKPGFWKVLSPVACSFGYLWIPPWRPQSMEHPPAELSEGLRLPEYRMLSCSQLTFPFSTWSPSSAPVTAAQPDFPPTSQTITSKSPCWSIFLWFPPTSCVFPGFQPLPCTLLILYTILGWPHHHLDLFSSLSPCMLMVLPRSESTYENSSGPQNPHRLRAMGHLHSDVPQGLQICRWPQIYTPCLMDACYHSPNS